MNTTGKRGPLKKETSNTKLMYPCKVCSKKFRGDELKNHYIAKVDFDKLENLKTATEATARSSINSIDNEEKRSHTQFFCDKKWFVKTDIPSYKQHKRPGQSMLTPFLLCEKKKKSNPDATGAETGNSDSLLNSEDATVEEKIEEESTQTGVREDGDNQEMEEDADTQEVVEGERNSLTGDMTEDTATSEIHDIANQTSASGSDDVIATFDNETNVEIEPPMHLNHIQDGNCPTKACCNEVKQVLVSALSEVLTGKILTSEMDQFVDSVSDKIHAKFESTKETNSESKGEWMATDTHYICQSCLRYKKADNVPVQLKQQLKGNFGFVAANSMAKHHCTRHEMNDLHKWCVEEQKRQDALNKETEEKSRQAGMLIVRNALFCLKRGLSAKDFMCLNDKDNMTEGITAATKNDSKIQFFDIRNIAFEKLTNMVKDIFANIEWFSLTLDKVTVGHISYTVIMTYFFFGGRIYVLLNKLVHLTTKDYNGPGTAEMVLKCLEETTRLTRSEISEKLVHVSYDGVYAEGDERIRGGGSLSLRSNLEAKLGLEKGTIKGSWDPAHRMQLLFGEMLALHPEVGKHLKLLFDAMKIYHVGKSATFFLERAFQLGNSVLSNKQHQDTRFVFSQLRGANSGMRNLPTIVTLVENDMESAQSQRDNTEAKRLDKIKSQLLDGNKLVMLIGIIQIMEKFTSASVESQNSFHFPSMVWKSINACKADIASLAKEWKWGEKELSVSGIGTPKQHIENLKKGKYIAFVPKGAKKVPKPSETNDSTESQSLPLGQINHEPDEDEDCPAGEFVVETTWCKNEATLKANLQDICATLCELWDERQIESEHDKKACLLFGNPHKISTLSYQDQFEYLHNEISDLISILPVSQASKFDAVFITPGFLAWNRYFDTHNTEPVNKVYLKWYQSLSKENQVQYKPFITFFECFNVRVMSEAICECVGSMMKSHLAGGRNLQPSNFSNELYLRFNLGPLHLLDPLCNAIIDSKPKMYFRKLDKSRLDKLVSFRSSAIKSFREDEEEKSTMPLSIFKDT